MRTARGPDRGHRLTVWSNRGRFDAVSSVLFVQSQIELLILLMWAAGGPHWSVCWERTYLCTYLSLLPTFDTIKLAFIIDYLFDLLLATTFPHFVWPNIQNPEPVILQVILWRHNLPTTHRATSSTALRVVEVWWRCDITRQEAPNLSLCRNGVYIYVFFAVSRSSDSISSASAKHWNHVFFVSDSQLILHF